MTALVSYCDVNSLPGGNGTTPATTGVNRAYSSQNEMEAAENKDFVADGDSFTGIMSGGRDSESVIWAGGNTSALFDIVITTTTDRHNGVFDNTKYYMDVGQSTQVALNIQEDFFSTIGIPFNRQSIAASGVNRTCIRVNLVGAGVIKTEQCIFKSSAFNTAGVVSAIQIDDSSPNYTFKNNICDGFNGSTHTAVTGIGASATVEIYSNTFIDHSVGIQSRANYLCKGNIFQNCPVDINGTLNAGNDYNLTDNGSIAGANSVTSSTLTFENKTANNYALAAGDTDAIGAGIGPSSDANVPTVDVIGTARTGTATDIGAFMFVGGGSGISLTPSTINSSSVTLNPAIQYSSLLQLIPAKINSSSISLDPVIQFSSILTIEPNTANSSSISLNPTILFSGSLNIAPATIDSLSIALSSSIQFGASINLSPNTINSLSVALSPVIEYTSALVVAPQTINSSSIAINPSIEFKSLISLIPLTGNSLSITLSPCLNYGKVQTIGTVTAGFADDKYSVKYKLSGITVNFKE
tara:strand:+ start:1165 stop:2739 length:1575 start_codon:yes stop_codon:yes gene_type:complete